MRRRRIGILGGLGSYPTVFLQEKILEEAKKLGANSDQDFPAMAVLHETQIPDRTSFLLDNSLPNPFSQLYDAVRVLDNLSDFIAIPCNTAHAWISVLQLITHVPILNMINLTKEYIQINHSSDKKWLLLATTGTIKTQLYQEHFLNSGIDLLVPSHNSFAQGKIMEAIYNPDYGMKSGNIDSTRGCDLFLMCDFEEIKGSSELQVGNLNKGYRRHSVLDDGDCGYTAFGITRQYAYNLISNRLNDVRDLLNLAIREVLLTSDFLDYLKQNGAIAEGVTLEDIENNIGRYASDLTIVQAYVNYDVRDKRVDAGWAHPAVLQALAHIQGIELHIWELGNNELLTPHRQREYADNGLRNAEGRVDLLFINGNHFERVEIQGGFDGDIYPLEIQKSQIKDNNLYLSIEESDGETRLLYRTKKINGEIVNGILRNTEIEQECFSRIVTAIKQQNLQTMSGNDKKEVLKVTSKRGHTRTRCNTNGFFRLTPKTILCEIINSFVKTHQISGVILGCTELSLLTNEQNGSIKFPDNIDIVDPLAILARECVQICLNKKVLEKNSIRPKL